MATRFLIMRFGGLKYVWHMKNNIDSVKRFFSPHKVGSGSY